MELRFKTNSFDKALRVALPLIDARADANQPLMPNEVAGWVEQRFPLLPDHDRTNLIAVCQIHSMAGIDG